MAIGELDNPESSGGRELPAVTSSDAPARPENTRTADRNQRADTGRHAPAETLTRQEYSDAMRAKGPSTPSGERAGDDPLSTDHRGAPASDTVDRDHGREPAEPRDRASYAADMRVSAADPLMDAGPSREGQDTTRAYGSPFDGPSTDRGQLAEPRSRDEYADAIHALPAEASQQHQIFRLDASGRSASGADLAQTTDNPSGDAADRVALGDSERTGPEDQPATQLEIDSSQQDRPLYREGPESTSSQDVLPTAGLPQASTPTDELNGQGLDTVVGEQPRDLDDADNASGGDDKAYVDGREYDVTHKSADGIWVSGLPGEMPGTPYGDPYGTARVGEVTPGDAPPRSRADRLFSTFCERGDDLVDIAEKGLNEMQDILGPRPPTYYRGPGTCKPGRVRYAIQRNRRR